MERGFAVPVSGSWATPANQQRVARRAEELGYRSLWTFQRLLYPADPTSARWAEAYRSVLDPLVVLGYCAAVTERVRLGVAVLNAPFFSPVVLAKQLATVDVVSSGRLVAALGLGWAPEEYTAAGASFEHRGRRLEEFVRLLTRIWTDEVVDFDGEFYRVPVSRIDPKPVQQPRPPLLLGGVVQAALHRAGRLADGWVSGSGADLARISEAIEVVRSGARAAGRDPAALEFVCRGAVRVRPAGVADAERRPLTGTVAEIRADLAEMERQGVTETFVDLNFDPEIGSPDADPAESMRRAEAALEAFAPD